MFRMHLLNPLFLSDLYLSDNICISIRSSICIYWPVRSFLHHNMMPIPYLNTTARTTALLFQTAMLIRSAVTKFLRPLYTRYNERVKHKAMSLYITAFPQKYTLSFNLNSVLDVSLQKPFVYQLFANCCISPSNKRMLIYKPYSFE